MHAKHSFRVINNFCNFINIKITVLEAKIVSEGQILFNFVKISFFTSISSNTASIISSLSAIFSIVLHQ